MSSEATEAMQQAAVDMIEDAMASLTPDELLLFLGWLEGVLHSEQSVLLAVRGVR